MVGGGEGAIHVRVVPVGGLDRIFQNSEEVNTKDRLGDTERKTISDTATTVLTEV